MTVGTKVKSCYASLKGAQTTIDMLANKSQDDTVKHVYGEVSQLLLEVIADLEEQLNFIALEEAEYK